ncbi:MAG: hypothetical protein KatS3mg099_100 [Candidatus Parcubacteria bacterium]|nr:MAG: hypothetical protein KatS3mg099_100 [Candidatus Parcubacteria bacterium]
MTRLYQIKQGLRLPEAYKAVLFAVGGGLLTAVANNWGEGFFAWAGAVCGVAGLWLALWRSANRWQTRAAVAWMWFFAYFSLALGFFFAATAADWLPLTPAGRWGAAALAWGMTIIALSLGAGVWALVPLVYRARGAWWGAVWAGVAFAAVEAARAWMFDLLTWTPEVGLGAVGTLAMPAYLIIEHPWGFIPARAGEVWALAAVLGTGGWALARAVWHWREIYKWALGRQRKLSGASVTALVVLLVLLGSTVVPPRLFSLEGDEPDARVAAVSFGATQRVSAQAYEPNKLSVLVAQALRDAAAQRADFVVLPENIPFIPFLRGYGWVAEAAQQLPPSAVVIASQTQETGTTPGGRAVVAAAFTARGEEIARREKAALVPIGEYLPLAFTLAAKAAGFSREARLLSGALPPHTRSQSRTPHCGAVACRRGVVLRGVRAARCSRRKRGGSLGGESFFAELVSWFADVRADLRADYPCPRRRARQADRGKPNRRPRAFD